MFGGFTFEREGTNAKHIAKALLRWGWFEITEGWHSWFEEQPVPKPVLKEAPTAVTTPA